ncbi:LPXTG cell wall anchor domain-containing protein [Lactococcus petauri]|uniref:LPXTG cell wall anchor domain-containing protein n=1 Tax=Lactococcus petauri TaxID=1940789 RepID=UPI003854F9D7
MSDESFPSEIPQNGQLVHYDFLPSTGSAQEYSLILFGCMLLLFVAVLFLARMYGEKGKLQ